MQIAIIGCGYVGLVTGACFANLGYCVTCADHDADKIRSLDAGQLPIYEPHLQDIVSRCKQEGRLSFITDVGKAIDSANDVFICVGTPPLENGEADLSAIDRIARTIATHSMSSKLVIEKSTVPVRTGEELKRALAQYRSKDSGLTFQVASNPEFLREGTAVMDFLHPDRIVIGVEDTHAEERLRHLYQPILQGNFHCPIHADGCPTKEVRFLVTSMNSAELIKHASNSFLALKISYANLIADLCERLQADVDEVTYAMGLDPRIGPDFLRAGLGFGGFCLPKDLQAFIGIAERHGVDCKLLKAVEEINRLRIDSFIEKARRALWVLKDKQIAVLGLAFKPNTDDIRFAPALTLIEKLLSAGACVSAYDPQAMDKTRHVFPSVRYGCDPYEILQGAEAALVVTEWEEFRSLDWPQIRTLMSRPLVLDGRNFLNPGEMAGLGFEFHSIGRQPTRQG